MSMGISERARRAAPCDAGLVVAAEFAARCLHSVIFGAASESGCCAACDVYSDVTPSPVSFTGAGWRPRRFAAAGALPDSISTRRIDDEA